MVGSVLCLEMMMIKNRRKELIREIKKRDQNMIEKIQKMMMSQNMM